jgi:hypothetical protein
MRFPLLFLFTAVLGLALAACGHSSASQLPPANPVGQWQWSNPLLGSWRLDIKADGTFQRDTKAPLDRHSVSINGRWTMTVTGRKATWLERHRVLQKSSEEEVFLQKVGIAPARRNNIQLSAPGSFSLIYYAPKDTAPAPGAVWTEAAVAEAILGPIPADMVGMEEKRRLRTFTDTSTGEVFLDLEGMTFQKATAATAAGESTSNGIGRDNSGGQAAAPTGANVDYLKIETFLGVGLDLPKSWRADSPDTPTQPAVPVSMLAGHPRTPRPNSSLRFLPPGDAEDTYVMLSVQAPTFTAEQLTDASQYELDRFAVGFVKTAAHPLESKGFFVKSEVNAERVEIAGLKAALCKGQAIDPLKNLRSVYVYTIPSKAGTVILACCWDPEAEPSSQPIIDHICKSLRIAENFAVAK